MVGFGCYYAGQPTKPVIKVTKMLERKEYNQIASLIRTGNMAEKYLAIIAVERSDSLRQYKLALHHSEFSNDEFIFEQNFEIG